MEINKITFEQMGLSQVSQAFEDLDVNKDGVINDKDKSVTNDSKIKAAITTVLNAADEDPEILGTKTGSQKTGGGKDKYGINTTDTANFENDVKNSKGTTYVIMGNIPGCGYCTSLASAMSKQLAELEKVANIYNMQWNDNNDLCWDIVKQGGITGSVGFPQIAKFVDGKFVGLVDDHRNAAKAIQNMIDGAEGTPGTGKTDETGETGETGKTGETGETGETGKTGGLDEAKKKELNEKLEKINKEIEELEAQIKTLTEKNTELAEQKKKLEEEKKVAEAEQQEAKEKLEEEQAKLEVYTKEYENYQQEIEILNKEILREQEREEEEFKSDMNTAVNNAIADYDPAKDGDDFSAYLAKKLDDAGLPVFTKLNSMNTEMEGLTSEAQTCMRNILTQSGIVQAAKVTFDAKTAALTAIDAKIKEIDDEIAANTTKLTGLEADLEAKKTEKTDLEKELGLGGLSAKEVLALIPPAEIELAKANNVDITKCLVAEGSDGKYHIYEPGDNWAQKGVDGYYMSVARKYGEGSGWSKGSDMAAWGSGELSLSTSSRYHAYESEQGHKDFSQAVYTFTCINDDWTDGECTSRCECYDTDSPLSFDVNGDGVKTTSETVSFDIDGDGDLDIVNNSADWVLAFDKDKDGIAGEDGSELFGNNTDIDGDGKADGYKDGFEALKALAKKEGLIGDNDNVLSADDIKKLSDKYGLVMTQGYGGEAKSLSELGITEINLATTDKTTLTKNFDGNNNDIMTQEGATFTVNGETREYADIWNAKKGTSEAVKPEKADEKAEEVKSAATNIKDVTLELNNHGVVALKGEVDYKFIQKQAMDKASAPEKILDEIVEIEEEIEE